MRFLPIFLALFNIKRGSSFQNVASPRVRDMHSIQHRRRLVRFAEPRRTIFMEGKTRYCKKTDIQSRTSPLANLRHATVAAALICTALVILPSTSNAIPISPSSLKQSLTSLLDNLSNSGIKGMTIYTLSFLLWTMTVGVTTPIETAAGMAFPLSKAIPMSALAKIGGAFLQYSLAKYIFRDMARKRMKDNEWMERIDKSFDSHPFRVALIWRFSPLPEFVKNIGPSLVPTLRTRYQIMATLVHGLPFTVLWSIMGNEAAMIARGGSASVFLKRMVAIISWVGLVVSPSAFGWWIKGLGDESEKLRSDEY